MKERVVICAFVFQHSVSTMASSYAHLDEKAVRESTFTSWPLSVPSASAMAAAGFSFVGQWMHFVFI